MQLSEVAAYLQRDPRDIEKLAARGTLPCRRAGNEWLFRREDVHHWLEQEMGSLSDAQLADVEAGIGKSEAGGKGGLLVARLLSPATMEVPLAARTAPAVLERLVAVANQGWLVYEPERVLAAVRAREALCTTALPGGVAIPHPRHPMPDAIGDSLLAFGRTSTGIPFGGNKGALTDLFFLVLCQSDELHLHVLARLARMFQRQFFLQSLREAASADEVMTIIQQVEEEVVA